MKSLNGLAFEFASTPNKKILKVDQLIKQL
jgi:hypothetical protein